MANKKILHSSHIRAMALIAMLSALAFVLQLWGIKFPFVPGFLTFDFSELPALIAAFGVGLLGVLVAESPKVAGDVLLLPFVELLVELRVGAWLGDSPAVGDADFLKDVVLVGDLRVVVVVPPKGSVVL